MAVDAVNNKRDTINTGISTGVGVLAGGLYGAKFSKPLLKGDAPSDAFVRRYYDNDAKAQIAKAGEIAKKEFAGANLSGKDELVNELKQAPQDYGIKAEDVDNYVKDLKEDALKAKMEQSYVDTAVANKAKDFKNPKQMQAAQKAFEKLGENPNEEALKKFVTDHAEILGKQGVAEADIDTFVKGTVDSEGKVVKTGKEAVKELLTKETSALTAKADDLKTCIKDGKFNLDGASDAIKDTIKKAAKDTKIWAGAKWAVGLGAILGLGSYIGSKMAAKVPEETK